MAFAKLSNQLLFSCLANYLVTRAVTVDTLINALIN